MNSMKKTLLSLTLLTLTFSLQAQVVFSTLTSNTLQDLEAIDLRQITSNTFELWTVGTGGTILHSSDYGATWTAQTSGVTATLTDVDFVTSTDGWISGSAGTILASQDAGTNWGIQAQGAPVVFNTVYFHSISSGIVMGDQAYAHTITGGSTWSPTMTDFNTNSVDFISPLVGFACSGSGFIYKTTDGGLTWTYYYTGTPAFLEDIQFISVTEGWISGYSGSILHTVDGGVTWTAQPTGLASSISGIKFFDTENGWACGYGGVIYHTRNGGDTWTAHTSGYTGTALYLKDLTLLSATEGIAVGEDGTIIHFVDNTDYTGVVENNLQQISVYPNPSSDVINLSISQPTTISITTSTGQIVRELELDVNSTIDVSTFTNGLYFIKTSEGQTVRFIKE
jgi:photosystem II stability/assembly factor-like uncharacterized protein